MCVFNDGLHLTGIEGNGVRYLWLLSGGVFAPVANFGVFSGDPNGNLKPSMIVDSPYLYVFNIKNLSSTWGCWQVDASYNVTDITSTVIPSGMTGTGAIQQSRTLTFADTDWAPGTNPPKYLIHAENGTSGSSLGLYAWQGPTSPMLFLDGGGNVAQAFSISKYPTASGFYIVGPPVCAIQSIMQDSSGIGLKVAFILQGPTAASLQNVRMWFGTANEEYLQRLGSLSNPSHGSLNAAGTAVQGLTVDNATIYSFTWTPNSTILGTNGVGERYKFALEAFQYA